MTNVFDRFITGGRFILVIGIEEVFKLRHHTIAEHIPVIRCTSLYRAFYQSCCCRTFSRSRQIGPKARKTLKQRVTAAQKVFHVTAAAAFYVLHFSDPGSFDP